MSKSKKTAKATNKNNATNAQLKQAQPKPQKADQKVAEGTSTANKSTAAAAEVGKSVEPSAEAKTLTEQHQKQEPKTAKSQEPVSLAAPKSARPAQKPDVADSAPKSGLKANNRTQSSDLAGRTEIQGRVNEKIVAAATAETLRVSPEDVKVNLFDDEGRAGLDITTVLRQDDVMRCAVRPDQSVYQLVEQARHQIAQKTGKVAGLTIGKTNVFLRGIKEVKDEGGLK